MSIDEIADTFSVKYINSLFTDKPENLRSIIWQAVQAGMADAYGRGRADGYQHGFNDGIEGEYENE